MLLTVDAICEDCFVLVGALGEEPLHLEGDEAIELIAELVHFLLLKALCGDTDALLLSPSATVDVAWHALILRT